LQNEANPAGWPSVPNKANSRQGRIRRRLRDGGRGAIVRNKAKLGLAGVSGGPDARRRADAPNKPNSRRGSVGRGFKKAGCGPWTNKPNSCHYADPGIGVPGRVNRAKQSQTRRDWGMWAKAVIVCGPSSPESGMCETNPIPGDTAWDGPRGRGANCAKRTQFAQTGREDHRQGPRPWRCHPSAGSCAEQTQCRQRVERVKCLARRALW
jgi:hypothetical protein